MFLSRKNPVSQALWAFLVLVAFLAGSIPTDFGGAPSTGESVVKWLGGTDVVVPGDPRASDLQTTYPLWVSVNYGVPPQVLVGVLAGSDHAMTTAEWHMSRRMRLSISPGLSPPVA